MDRLKLINEVTARNNKNTITYVSTFNPRNPKIFEDLRRDIDILKRDNLMKNVLENYKIVKSKRQPTNLKRIFTKAKFEDDVTPAKVTRCNRLTCGLQL